MGFLLAKFTLIFMLTAALAFILGHWWARRRFVDVTRSFQKLWADREPGGSGWSGIAERLDAISEGLSAGVTRAGAAPGAGSDSGETARPDLTGVQNRLTRIEQSLEKISASSSKSVDNSELLERLDGLERWITNLQAPEPTEITPLERRLDLLSSQIAKNSVTATDIPELQYLIEQLGRVEKKLGQQTASSGSSADLSPMMSRLDEIEASLKQGGSPVIASDNSDEWSIRFTAIEQRLEKIAARQMELAEGGEDNGFDQIIEAMESLKKKPGAKKSATTGHSAGAGPVQLEFPSSGDPDDLMRIFGVGRRLEKLLNSHGIYYFWQIAEWSDSDAAQMNELLGNNVDRIQDEAWVAQARDLAEEPNAAQKPGPA